MRTETKPARANPVLLLFELPGTLVGEWLARKFEVKVEKFPKDIEELMDGLGHTAIHDEVALQTEVLLAEERLLELASSKARMAQVLASQYRQNWAEQEMKFYDGAKAEPGFDDLKITRVPEGLKLKWGKVLGNVRELCDGSRIVWAEKNLTVVISETLDFISEVTLQESLTERLRSSTRNDRYEDRSRVCVKYDESGEREQVEVLKTEDPFSNNGYRLKHSWEWIHEASTFPKP